MTCHRIPLTCYPLAESYYLPRHSKTKTHSMAFSFCLAELNYLLGTLDNGGGPNFPPENLPPGELASNAAPRFKSYQP